MWFIMNLLLCIGGINIVDLYVALIVSSRRTIDQIPDKFKDSVLADLTALGLDGNGQSAA